MTIYFFFNSSGTNIVWISTTHAIKAMRKIGTHDNPIDNINHPVERKKNKKNCKTVYELHGVRLSIQQHFI